MGTKPTKTHIHKLQPQTTTNMNSMVMSSRKAVVARPANSRRVAAAAARNGSRVTMANSMQVLKPEKKYECLSYLPDLSDEEISKQVDYLVGNGWSPCIEFASQEEADTNQLSSPDLLSTRTDTGLCGSSLCSDAPTHSRSSTRLRSARRSTLDAELELSDSTESDRSRWLASSSESKLS